MDECHVSATDARRAAREVVTRVRSRDAYAHETLTAVLNERSMEPRESALATRLAYGTVACRGTLSEAIDRHATNASAIEPLVRDALCVSAYELLFAATPPRAAVSEGVELVREVRPQAAGFANAVLRRIAEDVATFPWGDPDSDDEALARLHGHPLWLAELWISELGREAAAAVMAANNEPAPLYLAHLPFGADLEATMSSLEADGAEPLACEPAGCIVARKPSAAVRSGALRSHRAIVADAGAQFAAAAVKPGPGQLIVDVGAGRGTKSLILAGLAVAKGGDAEIVAVDSHSFKLETLAALAAEIGATGVRTVVADATYVDAETLPPRGSADAVLVDAPCSGLGTLRRHPDRRWRMRPDEIPTLASLGASLLGASASLVKPGGFVVYSTCTIARAENEDVVTAFLGSEAGEGFSIDSLAGDVPAHWARFVSTEGFFQSVPEPDGPDGHFVARLVRA